MKGTTNYNKLTKSPTSMIAHGFYPNIGQRTARIIGMLLCNHQERITHQKWLNYWINLASYSPKHFNTIFDDPY